MTLQTKNRPEQHLTIKDIWRNHRKVKKYFRSRWKFRTIILGAFVRLENQVFTVFYDKTGFSNCLWDCVIHAFKLASEKKFSIGLCWISLKNFMFWFFPTAQPPRSSAHTSICKMCLCCFPQIRNIVKIHFWPQRCLKEKTEIDAYFLYFVCVCTFTMCFININQNTDKIFHIQNWLGSK